MVKGSARAQVAALTDPEQPSGSVTALRVSSSETWPEGTDAIWTNSELLVCVWGI